MRYTCEYLNVTQWLRLNAFKNSTETLGHKPKETGIKRNFFFFGGRCQASFVYIIYTRFFFLSLQSFVRALIAVVLYYYILACQPPKSCFSSGAKSIFLASLLQCTSIDRCALFIRA